jgi:hypothetical protein
MPAADSPQPHFTRAKYDRHHALKKTAVSGLLGPVDEWVSVPIIGRSAGGPLCIYCFGQCMPGTVLATMELIEPDAAGLHPNRLGTYEFAACTRLTRPLYQAESKDPTAIDIRDPHPFTSILLRMRSIFSNLARYATDAALEPGQTAEIPGQQERYVIFDEFPINGGRFEIEGHRHGLMLVMEILYTEMTFAHTESPSALLALLKEKGVYPYSDLNRREVFQ